MPIKYSEKGRTMSNEDEFYGPATSCNELGKLGHTLNGFYFVMENDNVYQTISNFKIVHCGFNRPWDKNQGITYVTIFNKTH